MTSMDCVSMLRKLYGVKKVGHCGTLDPNATGVLSVAFGSATRFIEYMSKRKGYNATTVRFGITTDTDDVWGSTIRHASVSSLEREVEESVESVRGCVGADTTTFFRCEDQQGTDVQEDVREISRV